MRLFSEESGGSSSYLGLTLQPEPGWAAPAALDYGSTPEKNDGGASSFGEMHASGGGEDPYFFSGPKPPSEKQMAFAQRLMAERGITEEIDAETLESSMAMSQFIDELLQQPVQRGGAPLASGGDVGGDGGYYLKPPSEKQVAFAQRLAAEQGMDQLAPEALESSMAMSQYIDQLLQQQKEATQQGGAWRNPPPGGEEVFGDLPLGSGGGGPRNLRVRTFAGRVLVDVREFYEGRDGSLLPTKKGIALSLDQWRELRAQIGAIDAAVEAAQAALAPPAMGGGWEAPPLQPGDTYGGQPADFESPPPPPPSTATYSAPFDGGFGAPAAASSGEGWLPPAPGTQGGGDLPF